MFNNGGMNVPSLSDIAAVTNGNDGFGGNNGWWVLIILFAIFGGWGRGGAYGGNGGVADNYVLTSDFARLQSQIDSTTGMIEGKLDSVNNGICSLGYDQLGQMNGINTNIFNAQTAIAAQLNAMSAQNAACCCETKNLINSNFADLNYNMATQSCQTRQAIADNARAVIENDNNNWRALDARLTAMEMAAKDTRINELQQQVNAMQLVASQQAQNNYIVNALKPCPVPAYMVPNPNASYINGGCCNNGYTGFNC